MPPRSSSEGGGLGADPVAIAAQPSTVHRISNAAITRNQFIAPSNSPDVSVISRATAEKSLLAVPICARHTHMPNMVKLHPHAEAIYKVVSLLDGTFGVEVVVPETYPTHIKGFATEAEAGSWIAAHKLHVQLNPPYRRTKPRTGFS